jgi:DNA-binding NtrC family response regulator/predicted hydrocarbon binding protein
MRAKDLNIAELIQFSPGYVGLQGRRLLIHDLFALGQFRRDLIETVGENMGRRILTRKGFFWGQADAAGMQRLYQWDSLKEWIEASASLSKISGRAQMTTNITLLDEAAGRIELEVSTDNSAEVEEYRNELGKASKPICWVTVGYISGYVSYCVGKSVYFVESRCQAADAPGCVFVGKDVDSWGSDIEKDKPYFLATDIQKKVLELSQRIRNQQRTLVAQRNQLKTALQPAVLSGIEVKSKSFRMVLDLAERVATFDTTVLITGETGTGKEVLARHIHARSARAGGPFLAINCSALPDNLLESELFGHKAGSFTGAKTDQIGLFKAAEKGTIFLDEIGDISPPLQAKLLRVIQSREIKPVGETATQRIDVRVVSATNRDLDDMAKTGAFRKDLLYRLRVVHITLPPLRQRRDDILPLTRHFLSVFQRRHKIADLRLSPAVADVLMKYDWPGNVRELENALEHAAVLCTDGLVAPDILPWDVAGGFSEQGIIDRSGSLENVERQYIHKVLDQTGGNRFEAARILGISESTLYRRLRDFAEKKKGK